MGFYYLSIFSLIFIALIYVAAIGMFWFLWVRVIGRRFTGPIVWVVVAATLIAPWTEELWIAYHFGQACKEAGTFIYKKVQVEGFYDSTMRSAYENTKPGRYRFVEHATEDRRGIERVERADDESRAKALAWYAGKNPSTGLPKDRSVIYEVSDREQIVVFPNGVDAWRVTKLDRPTARYHFKFEDRGTKVAHKIVKSGAVVIDSESNQQIARYASYGRGPSWFFIGLDKPAFACDSPGQWPLTKHSLLIYREVLIPTTQ